MNQIPEQAVASASLLSPPVQRPEKSCSQCRARKVKCDMNFPRCGGCDLRDVACEFTARRKPGPPKGIKRKRHQRNENAELFDDQVASDSPAASSSDGKGHAESLSGTDIAIISPTEADPPLLGQSSKLVLTDLESYCIDAYPFIQHFPYLPPLSRSQIFAPEVHDHVRSVLIQAVCAISVTSARELGHMSVASRCEAANTFAKRAKSAFLRNILEKDIPVTLSMVKIASILAAYELICSPSTKGWYMVGEAVRLAYDIGLDQVDSGQQLYRGVILPTEIEEKRYIWWCVYALDTYASSTLFRPFGITNKGIKTALIGVMELDNQKRLSETVFLPSDPLGLQIAIQSLDHSRPQSPKVLKLLLLSMVRQISTLRKNQLEGEEVGQSLDLIRNLLASYWFSLPDDFEHCPAARGHLYTKKLWIDITILAHLSSLSVSSCSLLDPEGNGFRTSLTDDQITLLPWVLNFQTTSLSSWNKCIASAMGILGVIRSLSPENLCEMSPFCIIALWFPAVVLALQMKSTHDANEQKDAESALHVLKAALKKLAKFWNVAHNIEEAITFLCNNLETITSTNEACGILYMYGSALVSISSAQITMRMPPRLATENAPLDALGDWLQFDNSQLDMDSLGSWPEVALGIDGQTT
ncbi:Citrinin biosynthesis transcriptional activator ctnR [Fusarium oxysporum f. sp. cubense]|uniref:Citrinin biosynthesis transcriptional activator ctnR n=1 Tax=Fusarium oxysporum f. sp. cubense TaxID=61366 RepID=A0A559KP80_FUSOC|nr:Citrinin biosynthesis transcriptional activator ctnR [Fusarium oxysporum f. sp. cubense]